MISEARGGPVWRFGGLKLIISAQLGRGRGGRERGISRRINLLLAINALPGP